jgi:cysteine synthase A
MLVRKLAQYHVPYGRLGARFGSTASRVSANSNPMITARVAGAAAAALVGVGVGFVFLTSDERPHWSAYCDGSRSKSSSKALTQAEIDATRKQDLCHAVGNTPLLYLKSLSAELGCDIFAKAEFMNPTSSVKDRAAKYMIEEAEKQGILKPGGCIIEATGGNTGVALAQIGRSKGYQVVLTVPNMIAKEKIVYAERFGATVHQQPLVPITDPNNFERYAATLATQIPGSVHTNQFENMANYRAHYEGTGPEIWKQTNGRVTCFVSSSGTGGTISGISNFLKEQNPGVQCILADPLGSALFAYVHTKQLIKEGSSTIEGIGSSRLTKNFLAAKIDNALQVKDAEAVEMAYYLMRNEGLFVGYSAALNVVGAVKVAKRTGPKGSVIVTILCDGGERYLSKIYDDAWLKKENLVPKATGTSLDFVEPW